MAEPASTWALAELEVEAKGRAGAGWLPAKPLRAHWEVDFQGSQPVVAQELQRGPTFSHASAGHHSISSMGALHLKVR